MQIVLSQYCTQNATEKKLASENVEKIHCCEIRTSQEKDTGKQSI